MKTISERLLDPNVQSATLENIVAALREKGEWGKYGLFSRIGVKIMFSASYVSKSLTGKKPLRENFVHKMAGYLGVQAYSLIPPDTSSPAEWHLQQAIASIAPGLEFGQRIKLAAGVREFIQVHLAIGE